MLENQNIEWKESWRDEYLKWICGFANAKGGVLVIGKNDKGKFVGIADPKKLLEDIPNKVRDLMGILVDVDLKTEKGNNYLEIKVEEYPFPVSYKGQYYYRSGSTKQELRGSALDKFFFKKLGRRWDSMPIPNLKMNDFDKQSLEKFKKMALKSGRISEEITNKNNSILLENLHLLEGDYFKRASVLLFHNDPEKFVTGSYIKIGFFRTESDLLYQDVVTGNLFEQADKTLELLLTKYLRAYISYEGINRIEKYPYPRAALREALLNAIIHKDYSGGIPIQIKVYENRIIFWNDGKLPENWTIQKLIGEHSSNPFNPDIANAFFRAGLIEAWGRGIHKITDECKKAGLPLPEFRYDLGGLWVEFKAKIIEKSEKTSEKMSEKGSEKGSEKSSEKIINLMKQNKEITITELSKKLKVSTRAIEKAIAKLKNNKIIERIGSDKGGYWRIVNNKNQNYKQ